MLIILSPQYFSFLHVISEKRTLLLGQTLKDSLKQWHSESRVLKRTVIIHTARTIPLEPNMKCVSAMETPALKLSQWQHHLLSPVSATYSKTNLLDPSEILNTHIHKNAYLWCVKRDRIEKSKMLLSHQSNNYKAHLKINESYQFTNHLLKTFWLLVWFTDTLLKWSFQMSDNFIPCITSCYRCKQEFTRTTGRYAKWFHMGWATLS